MEPKVLRILPTGTATQPYKDKGASYMLFNSGKKCLQLVVNELFTDEVGDQCDQAIFHVGWDGVDMNVQHKTTSGTYKTKYDHRWKGVYYTVGANGIELYSYMNSTIAVGTVVTNENYSGINAWGEGTALHAPGLVDYCGWGMLYPQNTGRIINLWSDPGSEYICFRNKNEVKLHGWGFGEMTFIRVNG